MRRFLAIACLACFGLTIPAYGQTSYPMVTRVAPTAIQRGGEATLEISGNGSFGGTTGLLFDGPGLSGEVLPAQKNESTTKKGATKPQMVRGRPQGSVRVKIRSEATTRPGPREIRLITEQGVSSIGMIVLVDDPVALESDDAANDLPAKAQEVKIPCVATGTIGKVEDVDWYQFQAKAGETVTFVVWGNRIENKIHDLQTHLDPILQLHDESGRELAANDNQEFADPTFSYTFPRAGTYKLQVRDTAYGGNANWTYVLHLTTRPYLKTVFPSVVSPGKTSELTGIGVNFDPNVLVKVNVPTKARNGVSLHTTTVGGKESLPIPLVVSDLPIDREEKDSPGETKNAQTLRFPSALSGRLNLPNDLDAYRFTAKKGTTYSFEVVARRAGSSADPVLRIYDSKDKLITEGDDTFGKDPRLEWLCPTDGEYSIQVGDLHSRGGDGFQYVVLSEVARPDFVATCDPDKLNIGPGARTTVFVKVERRAGFHDAVKFTFEGLPDGVTASPLTLPETRKEGVIVVEATKAAHPATGSVVKLFGESTGSPSIRHEVRPLQEIYLPGGGRGVYSVDTMVVGVSKPSDIQVNAARDRIVLRPGEKATIDLKVTRSSEYDKGVNLSIPLEHLGSKFGNPLPAGVTVAESGSKTLLGPKETQGKIVLQAAADAPPCNDVPIAVMGHVSINFVVKTAYSTAPIYITVLPKEAKK